MRGIVLAGGTGARLYPLTKTLNKHLLAVYDKPMIYYPISVLMLAGIREILMIVGPDHRPLFEDLLGDGSRWGINIEYMTQPSPAGIAEAFILGSDFIGDQHCALILGDNLFFGNGLPEMLMSAVDEPSGARIFAHRVTNPSEYGVFEFDGQDNVVSIVEKPAQPKSHWVSVGLYMYDNDVIEIAKNVKPSHRGELEITDVNMEYLRRGAISLTRLGRGYAWFDMGTPVSLINAGQFVRNIEERQGLKIGAPEEAAFVRGFISSDEILGIADNIGDVEYAHYLRTLVH